MKVAKINNTGVINAFHEIPFKLPELAEQKFVIFVLLVSRAVAKGDYEIVDRIIPSNSALFDASEIKQGHIFVKIE